MTVQPTTWLKLDSQLFHTWNHRKLSARLSSVFSANLRKCLIMLIFNWWDVYSDIFIKLNFCLNAHGLIKHIIIFKFDIYKIVQYHALVGIFTLYGSFKQFLTIEKIALDKLHWLKLYYGFLMNHILMRIWSLVFRKNAV